MQNFENEINDNFFCLEDGQSPQLFLDAKSHHWQIDLNSEQFAQAMDNHDPLKHIRREFHYPTMRALPYGLY